MIIANPIYDSVFKRMMENERVAKFFIGTLLNEQIETIEVKPQEFTYTDERVGVAVFRLDFIATIKNEHGVSRKILIEIQKAKNDIDLMRFRRYLAEQYKKDDVVDKHTSVLPITTIYVLGFNIFGIDTACLKVGRQYQDLVEDKVINQKSDFVEKLTHDCYIVQVDRITDRYQTRLDQLLSVFEQGYFVDDTRITKRFPHPTDNEDLKILTNILHHTGADPEERKRLEIEQEAWRSIDALFEKKERELRNKIDEKDKIIDEKDKALDEKDKALDEKDKVIDENKKALEEKDKMLHEMARQLEELKREKDG